MMGSYFCKSVFILNFPPFPEGTTGLYLVLMAPLALVGNVASTTSAGEGGKGLIPSTRSIYRKSVSTKSVRQNLEQC